ncbi:MULTISPECIES: amino acid ABC transporter permease [Streptomyces]|uniref:Amino acid ABC transporter permease n=2 Tax=Streptomyces TaxID=1883 RepID=A0A0W7WRE1_9ACTN|nr:MULTISPECIES: amino acid ABC transporter permease [Streptomyces]KUF13170.1 amino acid ABC transporter permease [Streptomyces silvensis]MVO89681.1 ABC transporter permease subunit [Streptomyces typhae]
MSANVLFDAPGPKARVRNIIYTVIGGLAVVGGIVWIILRLNDKGEFDPDLWDIFNYSGIRQNIFDSLLATLKVFALAGVLSLVFAVILCVARLSEHRPVRWFAVAFIDLFRSIPLLITIFALWVGLVGDMTPFWALVLGLTIYNGCVQAEVLRAGINAVPKGQKEAAYALGLRKTQVMATVLFPQAIRSMLPSIISQLVVTLKDTSLGFMILYPELLQSARLIANNTPVNGVYPFVQTVTVFGAIYISLCMLLSALATWLERRGRRAKTGIRVAAATEPTAAADIADTAPDPK